MKGYVAENLSEVSMAVALDSLEPTDPRYTDLSKARGTRDLLKLRQYLENTAATCGWASAAFIGHRGCGKSTELKRLEGELSGKFTSLHLVVDQSLQRDCDYTDLLLWLVDSLVSFFSVKELPLDAAKVSAVADWFAERTVEKVEELKKEIALETEAEAKNKAGVNLGLFASSLKLLARLKARMVGNVEHRTTARRRLQDYSDDLIRRVNDLLAHASQVLEGKGWPSRLLIVQDNLDRLGKEAALRLFRDNGVMLKQIQADCIWTVPINARLAPFGIYTLFNNVFSMPTIKVHDRAGKPVPAGIEGLVELIGKRMVIDLVFDSREVVAYLAAQSGGSMRDLLRLVGEAQLDAQVDGRTAIEMDNAQRAVKKLSLDFQGLFVPGDAYYPLLASVWRTKQDAVTGASKSPELADSNRAFFADLLVNGSVLEYNGDERWFDVQPVVHQIEAFRNACKTPVQTKRKAGKA